MKTGPIKRAIRRLNDLGGNTEQTDSVIKYWRTTFTSSSRGDYTFATHIYEEGGASLSAARVGIPEAEYFWSRSYALVDFDDLSKLLTALHDDLSAVLKHPTRIRQTRRLLSYTFSCEILRDGAWELFDQTRASRLGGFRFPPTTRKVTEYTAQPLVPVL